MIAHVFPGQGAQYVGMAKEFAESNTEARVMLESADDLLHVGLSKLMLDGPVEQLRQTEFTQPAIFLHSAIALRFDEHRKEAGAVAGHSLGEYTAVYAAGGMSFEDALRLVHLRGTLMAEAGRRQTGTMAAVIGMDEAVLGGICSEVEAQLHTIVCMANFNSPGQIVISGEPAGVHEVMNRAKAAGARMAKELSVSGAFHSPLMQYAADGLREALDSASIAVPSVPIYTNVTAKPTTDPAEIRELLVRQLTAPVRWEQSVREMYDGGVREFVEYGPGKVLQGLISRTIKEAVVSGIEKPAAVGQN